MKICNICNNKASWLTRKKLSNDLYLCKNCLMKIPKTAIEMLSHLNTFDIKSLIEYEEKEIPNLNKIFIRTCSYGKLHLDEINGLFAICDIHCFDNNKKLKFDIKDIFLCSELNTISMKLIPNQSQPNKNKIVGNLNLIATLNYPSLNINTIIKRKINVEYKEVEEKYIIWEDPIELKYLKNTFNNVMRNIKINELNNYYKKQIENINDTDIELIKAMAMFMIKDRNYTITDIKEQRNRLLKMYHPDEGNLNSSEYASDINHYYQILVKNIK